jgi:hypothetical protein
MKPLNFIRVGLAIGMLALGASALQAATTFVDSIGDGSKYQIGKELSRTAMLGFDQYPYSGDATGVRPTFSEAGVTALGTTGVPCAQLWEPGGPGSVNPITGQYAFWLVQPFVPASSGVVTKVQFIAQIRNSAGYGWGGGRTAYVDIIPAPSNGQLPTSLWQSTQPVEVNLENAKLGTLITANGLAVQVVAGQNYWVVFAPWNQLGVWNSNGLDYANLNWGWKSVIPDSARVADCLFSARNGLGTMVPMPGRALGIKVVGYDQMPSEKSIAEARMMSDGSVVRLSDVVISAKTGAVGPGFFYIEQTDRVAGIRVIGTTEIAEGTKVNVVGTVTNVGVERAVVLEDIEEVASASVPEPLEMVTRSIGGASNPPVNGVTDGVGLNNVGLLVRVAGQVVGSSGSEFVISDGGNAEGLICRVGPGMTVPTSGFVGVTGIVSLEEINGVRKPVLLVTKQQDIRSF